MMKLDAVDIPQPVAVQYLEHMDALRDEIKTGIDAVGGNQLLAFEESVAKQQQLCMYLCQMNEQLGKSDSLASPLAANAGKLRGPGGMQLSSHALAQKIRLAAESLQALNKQYAALLQHSGESIRLFSVLCQGYTGSTEMSGRRTQWSCEL